MGSSTDKECVMWVPKIVEYKIVRVAFCYDQVAHHGWERNMKPWIG